LSLPARANQEAGLIPTPRYGRGSDQEVILEVIGSADRLPPRGICCESLQIRAPSNLRIFLAPPRKKYFWPLLAFLFYRRALTSEHPQVHTRTTAPQSRTADIRISMAGFDLSTGAALRLFQGDGGLTPVLQIAGA